MCTLRAQNYDVFTVIYYGFTLFFTMYTVFFWISDLGLNNFDHLKSIILLNIGCYPISLKETYSTTPLIFQQLFFPPLQPNSETPLTFTIVCHVNQNQCYIGTEEVRSMQLWVLEISCYEAYSILRPTHWKLYPTFPVALSEQKMPINTHKALEVITKLVGHTNITVKTQTVISWVSLFVWCVGVHWN